MPYAPHPVSSQPASSQMVLERAESFCTAHGARLTPLRRTVLEIILLESGPLGAYGVMEKLGRHRNKRIAPPTVYRTLEFLVEMGLICRIESVHGYIAVSDPEEQHPRAYLLCEHCGTLVEMDVPEIGAVLSGTAKSLGFHIARQVVELQGICSTCHEAEGSDAG